MGDWEMLRKAVWRKESFTVLEPDARLLYLWSWTNPTATLCGLYAASARQLGRALTERWDSGVRDRVALALEALAARPLVLYDDVEEVIFVPGRVDHQKLSPQQRAKMVAEYADCPESALKELFLEQHGETLQIHNGRRP